MLTRDVLIKTLITVVLVTAIASLVWGISRHRADPVIIAPDIQLSSSSLMFAPSASSATPQIVGQANEKPDPYAMFIIEAYDKIMQIHWKVHTEAEMTDLFFAAYQSAVSKKNVMNQLSTHDRSGLIYFLIADLIPRKESEKRRIAVDVVSNVLPKLEPQGRDTLMSQHQEVALRQEVSNIDPNKDLYKDIGVAKDAPKKEVVAKFEEKKQELEASTTPEAKVQLQEVTYAKNVLTNTQTRARYDTNLIEPTVFTKPIGTNLLYMYISRISPTTMEEFRDALGRIGTTTPDYLVIDLRENIGGALDFPMSFFGAYDGAGKPAIALIHQGATWTEPTIGTKIATLDNFKKQIVITDRGTQSTAEVVSAMFKKKHLALLIGDHTAGWGTVENTFPMQTAIDPSTTYTLFLVHSLTLADDGKPIQGRGVTPDVNVTQDGWDLKLEKDNIPHDVVATLLQIMSLPPQRF